MSDYLDDLERERDGYEMRNEKEGVTIKCEEKFVEYWRKRGFVIVDKGKIRLVKE
ncbi:hypothetical protein BRE01_22070 [Brevibacillus reuszeri]|uniref:Acetyltransferase n=2 Tax=Brevibacillus reuszeri TaxID=54915 RepID=A0ABQ0TKQ4_9BACL|nr:hypothetical protein [Brevibacillus reuszeri]GED68505.1 hypothetical protein BRE01_22070 [Brevibacillus reuszeri]